MDIESDNGVHALRSRIALAFIVTITSLVLSIAANVLYDAFKDCAALQFDETFRSCVQNPSPLLKWRYGLTVGLSLAFFALSLVTISVAQRALFQSFALMHEEGGEKPKFPGVIFALSVMGGYEGDDAGLPLRHAGASKATKWTANAIADVTALSGAPTTGQQTALLDVFCDPNGPYGGWLWQQPLRVLRHNHEKLRVFCAILTKESEAQFPAFRSIVEPLLPQGAELTRVPWVVKRDDYNSLTQALNRGIKLSLGKAGGELNKLCIDTTGGTAIYSAAATVKTLNSGMKLSYVRSFGAADMGEVIVFDTTITG
jgi:hypothetical protein